MLPALLAGGACSLAGTSASAVQLGDIDVQSALGQPLRASIAYALSPNEKLHDYCIFLKPGLTGNDLPALNNARLTVAGGRINIAGSVPIREPMLTLGLTVDCPYTANLTRSYTLLLDPSQPAMPSPQVRTPEPVSSSPPVVAQRPTRSIIRRDQSPIPLSGSYRVRVGDTLSNIASRIDNRPVGLWQAVDVLFNANPDAFIDGDLNKLKAGSLLTIPSFDGATTPRVAAAEETIADSAAGSGEAASAETSAGTAYPGVQIAETTANATLVEPTSDTAPETPVTTSIDQTEDLRPGDVQVSSDRAFVSPIESTTESTPGATAGVSSSPEPVVVIPDTSIEVSNATPEISADVTPDTAEVTAGDSYRPLYWLAGTGAALLFGLMLFGRRFRRDSGAPDAPDSVAPDVTDEEPTARNQALQDIDYEIGSQPSTERQVTLDADLSAGTGLKDATDVEVAEDFGFSTTRDLGSNIDLLFPAAAPDEDKPETDIIPPQRVEEQTILEREILPSDDEYDLSMIVDATKQKFTDGDVTAKDLMAVALTEELEDDDNDEYTLSKEVDYKILEQDYEDELTATQALNAEIAKAAMELEDRLDKTVEMAGAQDGLDVTAEHAADGFTGDDDETEILTDLDDTGVNEELTAALPLTGTSTGVVDAVESTFEGTVEMPSKSGTARDLLAETSANTELTEELPSAENDPTVEMDVESGHFRTKKSVG